MKALLFFIIGNVVAALYFSHLYFQLLHLRRKRKALIFMSFPVRFLALSVLLALLFIEYGELALYTVAGIIIGRFIMINLFKKIMK